MKTVKEVSQLTGVSVRTLHHYDAIGLLKPTAVTEAGYRLYDDAAIARLHSILLFRELQFSLKEIQQILDSRDFDPDEALTQQIKMLELKYQNLGELITYAREIQKKGVKSMSFTAFEKNEIEQYKGEVRQRWGNTEAYREAESRRIPEAANEQMMELFRQIGQLQHMPPNEPIVLEKVAALQQHITNNYYTCSKEIFRGLGEMYVSDDRFRRNIDNTCGEGTADFASRAIAVFCSK